MATDQTTTATAGAARARVYFALWPDAATTKQLHATASEIRPACGGRVMRADTLHLTLAFIGDIPRARIPQLLLLGGEVSCPAFTLCLDMAALWERQHLIWAGPRQPPVGLIDLAGQLSSRLQAADVPVDRRVFKPHVTLIRRCERAFAEREIEPVVWNVRDFVLVESLREPAGTRYRVLARWPVS
ncbi:MAG: RNA 2',3'-cyclic phosphodiesterase [Rhodocyclales bacterium]|nr:RNA 2',3'-cyclic phosphodiesterase [Rhodocyclales bacterium]